VAELQEVADRAPGSASGYGTSAHGDLAHYFRFQQLSHNRAYRRSDDPAAPTGDPLGVDYEAVYPMIANPRNGDYPDPELRAASDAANRTWSKLLLQIDDAFSGNPSALVPEVHSMFRLRDQALVLLANPLPDQPGRHAGPTFEWTEP
jgi:hypothetical protein